MKRDRLAGVMATVVLGMLSSAVSAGEWPQWRGPQRDGVWRESGVVDAFEGDRIPHRWEAEIGSGYSAPSVANDRVYVTGLDDSDTPVERVRSFDWKTGEPIWSHEYQVKYEFSYSGGPRVAPLIEGDRVYTLGGAGHLHCFNAADGAVRWKRDLSSEYGIEMPRWGIAASPVIEGDLLIAMIGGEDACVVAFNKQSGEEVWTALPDDPASYSAPIVIDQAGRRVLVVYTAHRVTGLDPASGELLWAYDMPGSKWPITIATPVLHQGDLLFVSNAHVGSALLRLDQDEPGVEEVWRRNDQRSPDNLHSLIPTPYLRGDHIYGAHRQGQLRCLELMSGKQQWEREDVVPVDRFATVHLIGRPDSERVWLFNERGELIISELRPSGYREIDRAKLIEPTRKQFPSRRGGVVWTHPAFAYKHIFIRNDRKLICADLSAE